MSAELKKLELNKAGIRELLLSDEVQSMLEAEASARCPAGCSVDSVKGRNRVQTRISTDDEAAYKDNLNNNTLLVAIS